MLAAFSAVRLQYILVAILVYFIGLWIRAYRWKFLVNPVKVIPNKKLFSILIIGYMANNLLPLRMGDVYRAYVLGKKEQISKSASLATIVVERLFDGVAMLVFLVIGLLALQSLFTSWERTVLLFSALILLGLLLVLFIIIWNRMFAESCLLWCTQKLPASIGTKCQRWSSSFLDGLTVLRSGSVILLVLFYSLLSWLVEAGMYFLVAKAMQINLPAYGAPIVLSVSNLGMMIPSSPGAVGTFEFFCAKSATLFLGKSAISLSYALAVHALWFIPITILGLFYMTRENISFAIKKTEE